MSHCAFLVCYALLIGAAAATSGCGDRDGERDLSNNDSTQADKREGVAIPEELRRGASQDVVMQALRKTGFDGPTFHVPSSDANENIHDIMVFTSQEDPEDGIVVRWMGPIDAPVLDTWIRIEDESLGRQWGVEETIEQTKKLERMLDAQ